MPWTSAVPWNVLSNMKSTVDEFDQRDLLLLLVLLLQSKSHNLIN